MEFYHAYIETLDEYIGAKVVVPGHDSITVLAMVNKIKRDHKDNPIGTVNTNTTLNNCIFKMELPDERGK